MQLNVTTDYAIRTVLYLGQCKKIASATEISNEMGIPRGYLEKVLSKLKKAEYISADLGARGGYRLNKTLKEDRKSTRLNSSHITRSRMPSSA